MGSKSGRIGLSSANSTAAKRRAMNYNVASIPSVEHNNDFLLYKPKTKHALASAVSRFSKDS